MRTLNSKIRSERALKKILSGRKRKSAVFTNGCFDLLHAGHIHYLIKAKNLGKTLIVAINSDASVRKLKGNGRPINALKQRMEVLAALECVDYVTWFNEDTPIKMIRNILPGTLVKGGDWPVESIVGHKEVLAAGGKVRSLSYIDGQSTTRMIEKARKSKG